MSYVPVSNPEARRRFGKGVKPEPGLTPGVFPAFMADFDNLETFESVQGQYGESIKIRYGVLVLSRVHGAKMYEINELCADSASVRSKLVSRAAAVTPGVQVTDETDLGDLNTSGWCMVELENDSKPNQNNTQYLRIKNVMALPAGMADQLAQYPVVTGWDNSQNRQFVRLGQQHALPEGGSGTPNLGEIARAIGGSVVPAGDEPPF